MALPLRRGKHFGWSYLMACLVHGVCGGGIWLVEGW